MENILFDIDGKILNLFKTCSLVSVFVLFF